MTPLTAPPPFQTAATLPQAPAAPDKIAKVAREFESIFVRQMLAAARKSDFGEPLLGGQGLDTFRTMQDERLADIAAERGSFGFAKLIEAQLRAQAGGGNGQ